jgi:enterobactin synthetase component D
MRFLTGIFVMLQTLSQSTLPPFLPQIAEGRVITQPHVRFCSATFSREGYSDALFSQLGIMLPQNLHSAVEKRRAEYLAGRWCCHRLLAVQGVAGDVTSGLEDRAPRWPAGIYGSISHADNRAIAAAVYADKPWRIGIDVERFNPKVMQDIASEIVDDKELACLRQRPGDLLLSVLLAFSAKESLYKALWPEVRAFFGFDAAALVAIKAGIFTLSLRRALAPRLPAGLCFNGVWRYNAPFITTLICAPL